MNIVWPISLTHCYGVVTIKVEIKTNRAESGFWKHYAENIVSKEVFHHTFASQSFYANPLQSKVSMHPGKNHPSNPVLLSSFKKKYNFFLWESQKERRRKKINSISSSILKYFYHILPWSSYTMIQLVSSISFLVYVLLLLECTAQCANSINRLNEPWP